MLKQQNKCAAVGETSADDAIRRQLLHYDAITRQLLHWLWQDLGHRRGFIKI